MPYAEDSANRPVHFLKDMYQMAFDSPAVPIKAVNFSVAAIFLAVSFYFVYWGLGYTGYNQPVLFVIAAFFGIFMAFNIGGNDVANSFGTSVGAGTLTIPQALAIAAVFEVSGALLAGGEVTSTIRSGIVDLDGLAVAPLQFVCIMMAALAAAAFWLLFATYKGWPVSTTHSIIGGIVGASLVLGIRMDGVAGGVALVQWDKIGEIVISWVLSPMLGGLASYVIYKGIKKYILGYNDAAQAQIEALRQQKNEFKKQQKALFMQMDDAAQVRETAQLVRDGHLYREGRYREGELVSALYRKMHHIEKQKHQVDAFRALQLWVPLVGAFGGMIMTAMLLFKGLKHLNLGLTDMHNALIVGMVGLVIWLGTYAYARQLKAGDCTDRATFIMFSWLQVITACGFAFSHGSNDIANAIGPFAAIMDVLKTNAINSKAVIPYLAMFTFGLALIVGLWFIGKEVIATVGENLAKMHPSSGFTAELAAAAIVMLASALGLPVSSTHILVGAVLGIGLVNRNANWDLMKPIAMAWVITLPAAASLSAMCFVLFAAIFV